MPSRAPQENRSCGANDCSTHRRSLLASSDAPWRSSVETLSNTAGRIATPLSDRTSVRFCTDRRGGRFLCLDWGMAFHRGFDRRCFLIGALGAAPALLKAKDFWETKDPSAWTEEEILSLTSKSPWAKLAEPDYKGAANPHGAPRSEGEGAAPDSPMPRPSVCGGRARNRFSTRSRHASLPSLTAIMSWACPIFRLRVSGLRDAPEMCQMTHSNACRMAPRWGRRGRIQWSQESRAERVGARFCWDSRRIFCIWLQPTGKSSSAWRWKNSRSRRGLTAKICCTGASWLFSSIRPVQSTLCARTC